MKSLSLSLEHDRIRVPRRILASLFTAVFGLVLDRCRHASGGTRKVSVSIIAINA
jgi:hypothetical protein